MPPKKTTAKLPPKKSSTDNKNNNNISNNNKSSTTDEPEKQQQSNTGRPPYDPYKQSFVKQDYFDHQISKQDRNNNINDQQQISEIEDLLHIPDPQPFLVSCVVNHIHNLRVMVDPRDAKQKKRDEKRHKRRKGTEKQQQQKQKQQQRQRFCCVLMRSCWFALLGCQPCTDGLSALTTAPSAVERNSVAIPRRALLLHDLRLTRSWLCAAPRSDSPLHTHGLQPPPPTSAPAAPA